MGTFRARIEEAAFAYPMERCRLTRLLFNSKCPPRLIHEFAVNMIRMADGFSGMLARLFAATPHAALRAVLLENMFEEEGIETSPAGFEPMPAKRHSAIARKFGQALGIGEMELAGGGVPAYVWFQEALEHGNWLGAFAYLNIGMEANMPRVMDQMHKALLRRGFAEADVEFFALHGQADVVHGNRSIDVALQIATTPEQQQTVLDGVARGAREFWEMNN